MPNTSTADESPVDYMMRLARGEAAVKGARPVAAPVAPSALAAVGAPVEAAPVAPPAQATPKVEPVFADNHADALATALGEQLAPPPPPPPPPPAPAPVVEPVVEPVSTDSPEDGAEDGDGKKGPKDSLRDMRKINVELKNTLAEREARAAELEAELTKYRTGEAVPEKVMELEGRVSELKKYQHLHALKTSEEYQRAYVDPLTQLENKAVETAKEYGVNPAVLAKAVGIDNKRDLNAFLRQHFDDVGALEVRDIVLDIKELRQNAAAAEQAPAESLEALRQEYQREQSAQRAQRSRTISTTAKSAWIEALNELRADGRYPEVEVSSNLEQNKITQQIVAEAAKEFGGFVKNLGDLDVKDFPPLLAKETAKRWILAQAMPIAALSRANHYQRAEEVVQTVKRQNEFVRPKIGGSAPVSAPAAPRVDSLQQAARSITESVLRK